MKTHLPTFILPGGFNHDGLVNIADFSQLLIYWNAANKVGDIKAMGWLTSETCRYY